jgi:hypothetical protein
MSFRKVLLYKCEPCSSNHAACHKHERMHTHPQAVGKDRPLIITTNFLARQNSNNNFFIKQPGTFLMLSPEDKGYVQQGESLLRQLAERIEK